MIEIPDSEHSKNSKISIVPNSKIQKFPKIVSLQRICEVIGVFMQGPNLTYDVWYMVFRSCEGGNMLSPNIQTL